MALPNKTNQLTNKDIWLRIMHAKFKSIKIKSKLFFSIAVGFIFYYYFSNTQIGRVVQNKNDKILIWKRQDNRPFVNEISETRLNRLFEILKTTENKYFNNEANQRLSKRLGLISFKQIRDLKETNWTSLNNIDSSFFDYKRFKNEIDGYLSLSENDKNNNIKVTDTFVKYLLNNSNYYSYKNPRDNFELKTLDVQEVS